MQCKIRCTDFFTPDFEEPKSESLKKTLYFFIVKSFCLDHPVQINVTTTKKITTTKSVYTIQCLLTSNKVFDFHNMVVENKNY